jgi:hypothetical protein
MIGCVFSCGRLQLVSGAAFLLLLPVLVGCGPGQGTVTGQVLFNGKPLPGGRLLFKPVQEGINPVSASLDEQGHYQAVLPGGEVQVSVDNRALAPHPEGPKGVPPGLPPAAKAKMEQALKESAHHAGTETATNARQKTPGKYVEIPRRYYDIATSGLRFTVERGTNPPHNIELTK